MATIQHIQSNTILRDGMKYGEAEKHFLTKGELYRYFIEQYEAHFVGQGITQRQFCESHNILLGRFVWWRRQWRKGSLKPSGSNVEEGLRFVEMATVCRSEQIQKEEGEREALEVILKRTCHRIRIRESFNERLFLRVVSLLEGEGC